MINICIIDDSPMVRIVAKSTFEKFGNLIIPNIPEAIFTIDFRNIDLLILDINMPYEWIYESNKLEKKIDRNITVWYWTVLQDLKEYKNRPVFKKGETDIIDAIKNFSLLKQL